jgi:hypothetical protein
MDFVTQQQQLLRQRRLADLLRAQAEQTAPYTENPGRMVSGHYVAPSWSQNLAGFVSPILQRGYAQQQENRANQQEQAYGTAVDQARQQWQSALPQTIAGRPELQGPQDLGGSPELAAVPPQLPDRGAILKATMAGLEIPGNEKAAGFYNAGMSAELEREDRQKEATAMQKERLAEARSLRIQQLEQRKQELADKLAQQERENIRDNETRRMHQETLRTIAQERAAVKVDKADPVEQRAIMNDVTKLSTRMAPINSTISAAQEVQNMIDEYTDPKTGKAKSIPGVGRDTALPGWARSVGQQMGMLDPATNPNSAKVQRVLADIMRQQAGLSQTISEQARVIATNLGSGAYTQKEFLDAWGDLKNAIANDLVNIKAGHRPEAVEIYQARGGKLEPVQSKANAPSRSASGKVGNDGVPDLSNNETWNNWGPAQQAAILEDIRKMPPGTIFTIGKKRYQAR